jgi:hypothetical protein
MYCPSKRSEIIKIWPKPYAAPLGDMGEKSKRFKIQKKFEKVVWSVCSLCCGLGRGGSQFIGKVG